MTVEQNFDDLLIKKGHVSRRPSDTYYVDAGRVLRTHTSAHQSTLIKAGHAAFLASGDVYRRDEIDRSHYPVFHQMEGVRMWAGDPALTKQEQTALIGARCDAALRTRLRPATAGCQPARPWGADAAFAPLHGGCSPSTFVSSWAAAGASSGGRQWRT